MNYSEEEIVNMKISKICCDRSEKTEKAELYSVIPVITEEKLCHDESGYSYNSGSFMVMEAMLWNKTMVTTRRLHKVPPPGAVVDMLMRESIFMSRLRHPNILLLVATCQTSNPESLVLLYERVYWGSLYQFLYQKYERMAVWEMCALMRQICSAVAYLHESDLLHTTINSHSIHVVSQNLAKLGNFEYMVENNKRHGMQTKSIVTQSQQTSYLFHWTAPEVLSENAVSEMTDLYSLCAVIWEILHGSIPWVGLNVEEIKCKVLIQKKRLQIEGDYLESPFNVILQQGLSMYPSCRKITVSDLQDILTNIITNRDQITLSQQNVTPKKRTKISSSELKCKNHHRKSFPEQSLRVSFDDTDALMYEPSIKSSTPARKIQSARPAISASPNAPPRRRSKRSPMPQRSPVPQPEDIIQVSISSIEGSQKKTSPVAFPRSLSNESRVQRSRPKLTSSLKPCLSSDHSISLNESAISVTPAVIAVESNTVSNFKSMSDENSSVVRRSLFQGPQPYKPSPSSLTKVSFRPNTSKGQLPNCSDTSSLTQMPQLTSSSQSNGQNLSNYVLTSPSDSPVVISRQIVGLSRPLESSDATFRLSKTLCGYTKLNMYDSKTAVAPENCQNLKSSQSDMVPCKTTAEDVPVRNQSASQLKTNAPCQLKTSTPCQSNNSAKKAGRVWWTPLQSAKSECYESEPRSPYLASGRNLDSCENIHQKAFSPLARQPNLTLFSSTEKTYRTDQGHVKNILLKETNSQIWPVLDHQWKAESKQKSAEMKTGITVNRLKNFFEKKEDLNDESQRPLPSKEQVLVEKDGYLKTFAGWVKLDTPNSKAEKLNTPGRTPAATSGLQGSAGKDTGYQRSAGKDSGYQRSAEKRTGYQEYAENLTASARKKAASLSVDQGIQIEGPLDIDHRFDPELKANEKQSWGELPSVQRRINNFQEIADKKKEKEEKFEAFFNKSLSHREGSTTSTPLATGRKEMVVGNLSSAPMVEEKYVRYMSPDSRMEHVKKSTPQKLSKSSSESTHQRQPEDGGLLTHTLRRANDLLHQTCEGDVDLKAKEARDSRIFEIREKHERRQTELETKKSMSDTLLEDYPYSTSAMEFCSRMDHIFEPKTTACSNTTTQEPSETVRICQTVTTTCSSSNGGLDQVDSKHATGRLQRSREPWLGPVSNEEDPQMSTKTTYVDESVKLQEKLAEFMTGSQEDSYFDDVLHPECKEERHLRLQTTLALDQSLLDSEILPVGSPTADDTTFLVEKNTDLSSLTLEELDSPHKGEKLHLAEGAEKSADSQIDEESEAIEGDHEEGAHAVVTHVWNSNQIEKIGQNLSNQNNNALADYGQHQMYRNDSQEDVCESGELHVETVHDNIEFQGTKDNAEIIPINFSHERDCLNEEPVILSFTHTDQFDPTDERSLNQNNNSSTGFAEQHRYGGDTNLMQELENEEMAEKSYAAECSADSTHDGNISEMVDSIVNTTQALHFPLETITEDTDHSGLETTSEEAVGLNTSDCSKLYYHFQVNKPKKPTGSTYKLTLRKKISDECLVRLTKRDRATGRKQTLYKDQRKARSLHGKLA